MGCCRGGTSSRGSVQQRGLGRLRKNIHVLQVIADPRQPTKLKEAIYRNADNDLLAAVSDCCMNVAKGNVPISPTKKRYFTFHKKGIRLLGSPHISFATKRKTLVSEGKKQRGGFVPALIAAAIPILADLVYRQFAKK